MNPAVWNLWSKWQNVLRIKSLWINKDQAGKEKAFHPKITLTNTITGPAQNFRNTGSESREVSDAVLAAARLADAVSPQRVRRFWWPDRDRETCAYTSPGEGYALGSKHPGLALKPLPA